MRVLTLNVNGLRAAVRKGFYDWLEGQDADFVCLQEIKACAEDVPEAVLNLPGYSSVWHPAKKKG